MWLAWWLLSSLVGGTILGISWHLFDEWKERTEREALEGKANTVLEKGCEEHQMTNSAQ